MGCEAGVVSACDKASLRWRASRPSEVLGIVNLWSELSRYYPDSIYWIEVSIYSVSGP